MKPKLLNTKSLSFWHIVMCGPQDMNQPRCAKRQVVNVSQEFEEENVDISQDFEEEANQGLVVVFVILLTLTILANLLVMIAFTTNRQLRNTSNWLILALTCADMGLATTVMPFSLATFAASHWIFGTVYCNVWIVLDYFWSCASVYAILLVGGDRFYAVHSPVDYASTGWPGTRLLLPTSILLTIPVIVMVSLFDNMVDMDQCSLTFEQKTWFICLTSSTGFFLPLILILALYTFIVIKTRRVGSRKLMVKGQDTPETVSSNDGQSPLARQTIMHEMTSKVARIVKREKRLVKITVVIIAAFVACWTPFWIVYLIVPLCNYEFCQPISQMSRNGLYAIQWIGYANSLLNPIIYTVFNTKFRTTVGKLLKMPLGFVRKK